MRALMELLCQLICIPSLSGNEKEISGYVADWMRPFCDSVQIDGLYNVIAEIKGNRPGKTVLFNAHLDTVPPGDMEDPFVGQIVSGERFSTAGEVVYGRGACDDKGGVAAMMTAARRLAANRDFAGSLIITFVTQEENGQAPGTIYALDHLKRHIDFAVLGEATGLDLYLGHRGKVEYFLDFYGRSAHASNPGNGINAVTLMSDFVQEMKSTTLPAHPILGVCTWALTYVSCTDPGKTAMIPAQASIRFDRRYLPEESSASVQAELDESLQRIMSRTPGGRYNLRQNYIMPPYYVEPASPEAQLIQRAVAEVRKEAPKYKTWISGTDGTFIFNNFGIPTIGFGPGSETDVHSSRDHVSGEHLMQAADVYERIVRTLESL